MQKPERQNPLPLFVTTTMGIPRTAFRHKGVHFCAAPGTAPHFKLIDAVLRDGKLHITACVGKIVLRGHPHGIERGPDKRRRGWKQLCKR